VSTTALSLWLGLFAVTPKGAWQKRLQSVLLPPEDIRRKIEEALRRAAGIDASRITIESNGSEAILKGTVRSWAERQEAERAAWSAGVAKVDNRIIISP
jgi:osmotically-inducible protein OsmY